MKFKEIEFKRRGSKWVGVGYLDKYVIVKNGDTFEICSPGDLSGDDSDSFRDIEDICREHNNKKLQNVIDEWIIKEELND